jgi:transcriptional regulator with XRE-family HTH domain
MKKSAAMKHIEKITGEVFSFSTMVKGFRTREDLTQEELATILGVKKSYISNIENRRDFVTLEQAVRFSELLNEPVEAWARVALQDMANRAGLNFLVEIKKSA